MEEELEDCSCNWFCSCKVLLRGKRSFPEYLKLKEYQDFIRGPQPEPEQRSTSSSRTGRRFGSAELGQSDDPEVAAPGPGPGPPTSGEVSAGGGSQIQGLKRPWQTENDLNQFKELGRKSTLVNGQEDFMPNGHTVSKTTSTGAKLIKYANGTMRHVPATITTKNGTDPDNRPYESNKTNNLGVNGGDDTNVEENSATISKSGYNCRNRSRFHKCSTCGKMFHMLTSLQMHEKEHILESWKSHKCNDCGKCYSTVASYERHLKTHPKCLLCRKTMTMKQVENQPEEEIGINVNLCKKCRKNDAPLEGKRRRSHVEQCVQQPHPAVPSTVVNMNGDDPAIPATNGFNDHHHPEHFDAYDDDTNDENEATMTNGNGDAYLEDFNEQKLADEDGTMATGDETILFCDYCGAMFDCSEDFYPHYQEHGKHEFECRYCLLPFSNSDEVGIHEKSHDTDRPWNCLFCPIKFRSQVEREFHERFHT